jgi:hypothetical protein
MAGNISYRKNLLAVLLALLCAVLAAFTVIADVPVGSIVIYGPNGTVTTGTRNVMLNLSYGSAAHGIGTCRWANDAESNLASAPWENCTTVKAWILSSGEGNKTVYFQVRDLNSDTVIFNDSIIYQYTQDYTAPTPPTVYDGTGADIDWWNSNTTLSANWFNATEDISVIYYWYRIYNGTTCYAGDCSWKSAGMNTTVTVGNLVLQEGRNYSFEVIAQNPFGLNSSIAASNSTVIDLTEPNIPFVNSPTHPDESVPSSTSTAVFNFTATDVLSSGVFSGIDGYSYSLDRHPGTAPDNTKEERAWQDISQMHKGDFNQTLKANSTGAAYAVFSQLHSNFTGNDSVRVSVALAEQVSDIRDLMGVKVYLAKTANEDDAIAAFSMESNAISDVVNISRDVAYAADMSMARTYVFNLTVNETVDDNLKDIYVVVSGITSDDDNNNTLAISGTTTIVDNTTRNYACDEANNCHANTSTLDYAIEVRKQDSGRYWTARYDYLGDGTYYFHVKAKDKAGNWGEAMHYKAIIEAGGVSSLVTSPVDGEAFYANGSTVNVTVRVSVSRNASVYVVAKHPDGSNDTSPPYSFSADHEFYDVTLEVGQDEIYAVANTSGGAVSHSPSVYVIVSQAPPSPTNKTLRVAYSTCGAVSLYLCNMAEPPNYVGAAAERGSIASSTLQADTSVNALKIYMTRAFDTTNIANQFAQDIFLDRINPMFGYIYGSSHYVIQNELRYNNIFLGGDFTLPPGHYSLYLRKNGRAADGRYNITLTRE